MKNALLIRITFLFLVLWFWAFTAQAAVAVLVAPTLNSPGSGSSPGTTISTLTPTMSWNAVSGATGYGLYVADQATGTLVYDNDAVGNVTSLTLPSGKLVAGRSYRWNMRASNSAGFSGYSDRLYFQEQATVTVPSAPTLNSPGSGSSPGTTISTLTPTMSWNAVSGATGYGLYVADQATGTLVYDNDAVGNVTSLTLPSGKLVAGRSYRWNMRASNSAGFSGYSDRLYFQEQATTPPPPSNISTTDAFDYPIGTKNQYTEAYDGDGWYVAMEFNYKYEINGKYHLGEDWNAESGGNTDYGLPVYAIANGTILFAGPATVSGWGNVLIIRHKLPDGTLVESLYGHVASFLRTSGDVVTRGEQVATIGKAPATVNNPNPPAHLHLEVRFSNCPYWGTEGYGYSTTPSPAGWTDPSDFIDAHRPNSTTDAKITVTAPNGSENWTAFSTQNITWTSQIVENVKIEYSTDNGTNWKRIVASTAANAETYSWTVLNEPSTQCLVRISDSSNARINDVSNGMFTIMNYIHEADFNGDGYVNLSDIILLGNMWGLTSTNPKYSIDYDLNKDGSIGLGDLIILINQWTSKAKVAKSAPAFGVALFMTADRNESTSMFFVNVSAKDASRINGVSFSLKYDANLFEFVKESAAGLGTVSVTNETTVGTINIASLYDLGKFSGTITLGFKAKGKTSDMNVAMVNTEVSLNGVVGSVEDKTIVLKAMPKVYELSQNFPNPFNPSTTISFTLMQSGESSVTIFNIKGQKIRTIANGYLLAGYHYMVWNGDDMNGNPVASGTYIYELISPNGTERNKMLLVR